MPSRPWPRRATAIGVLAVSAAISLGGCGDGGDHDTAAPASTAAREAATVAVVHRTPSCGCCKSYEEYLRKHGYEADPERVERVLDLAKRSTRVLSDAEIEAVAAP